MREKPGEKVPSETERKSFDVHRREQIRLLMDWDRKRMEQANGR